MNQLECFRQTVAHKAHDCFLYTSNFTEDLARRIAEKHGLNADGKKGLPLKNEIKDHFGMFRPVAVSPERTDATPKHDFTRYYKGIDMPEGSRINAAGCLRVPVGFYHFTKLIAPLRDATSFDEIEAYPLPEYIGYDESGMAEQVRAAHEAGRVASGSVCNLFENSWQIRGIENFMADMALNPEWCEHILDHFHAMAKAQARAAARAGVDFILTGDDVGMQTGMMMSKDLWEHFINSRWKDIYAAAKAIKPDIEIFYHSDGDISSIVPDLIETGVTILNPIQPECLDPYEIKDKYGDRLALYGTIGTQSTMPFGTPDEVRRVVHERIERCGGDGALILAPTHTLEPEVPIENVEAFVEAVREHGVLDN